MSLVSKLAFQVDKHAQWKGYQIFRDGGVIVVDWDHESLRSRVKGGHLYDVGLFYADAALEAYCTCPAYEKYGPCKHIWASILEADRRGALADARNAPRLSIEGIPDDDDFGDDSDLECAETFEGSETDWERVTQRVPQPAPPRPPPVPLWKEQLEEITQATRELVRRESSGGLAKGLEVSYMIDVPASRQAGVVVVHLSCRTRKKNGEWSPFKELRLSPAQIRKLPDRSDAVAVSRIVGGQSPYTYNYSNTGSTNDYALPPDLALQVLPDVADLGRLWIVADTFRDDPVPANWDGGEAWRFHAAVRRNERDLWELGGELRRGEERLAIEATRVVLGSGMLIHGNTVALFDDVPAIPWIRQLRSSKTIVFADRDRDEALRSMLEGSYVPPLEVDPEFGFEEREGQPRFGLSLRPSRQAAHRGKLDATLLAAYGNAYEPVLHDGSRGVWIEPYRVYAFRDLSAEAAAAETLRELGVRLPTSGSGPGNIAAKAVPRVVRELVGRGWHVEAEGGAFRRAGNTELHVRSGIDWFELHGGIEFDGQVASLPDLLAALRKGDGMVKLGDGSFGILPEEWLQRFAPIAGLGEMQDGHLRFRSNQATLLDALLASQPEVRVDEMFARARERMRSFQGVQAAKQPKGFHGQLRQYQLEGLGWIEFLREFGFGGILADDMGVGKTAQVLAALEIRRVGKLGPSLVVAPRSLLFNWRQEAERFTPKLKVLEHSGLGRDIGLIEEHDVILTTYGTLQRDIAQLSKREFDYVILDEAQAIKNASTISAKAVRLLKGHHRLALSGTPVENHLGELWSIFEFLNPGMLGEAKVLKMSGGLARNPSPETRQLLSAALRPYILRRTKQQVAKELPEKTEQTIYCQLEGEQLRKYNQLRDHYRKTLLERKTGAAQWNKMRMHVLEALLRLRQAACHPGLLDPTMTKGPSAKFSTLMAQLEELRNEGHKALIFSQFTSLHKLLREQLDQAGFRYEYLDGATIDRQARVEHFQNDAECQLFLISLKAGGVGLNLTAASYVFLLDPWWNPAVEAQAIDRTHRIGQTRNVFAYRLIAQGTVEEKVLELQKSKRDLADAILGEDNSLLRGLKREDLELLLS